MSISADRSARSDMALYRALAAAGLLLCSTTATMASIAYDDDPELFVIVWDPIKDASYSLDLGIHVNAFRINAQQDTGMQQFWKLSTASDPRYASFRALGTDVYSLRWGVYAFDVTYDSFLPGDRRGFTTLQQGTAQNVLNPVYNQMINTTNGDFIVGNDFMGAYVKNLSELGPTVDPVNNHHAPDSSNVPDNSFNGSSFDKKGQPGYFGASDDGFTGPFSYGVVSIPTTNQIGKSSWFYALTDTSYDLTDRLAVDEFDNIGHDGYWGLGQDKDGSLALSYTLQSAVKTGAQIAFGLSIGRSEFDGGFATRRLAYVDPVATPQSVDDYARRLSLDADGSNLVGLAAAVPEPQTWGLMLAGLCGLAAVARRRRTA